MAKKYTGVTLDKKTGKYMYYVKLGIDRVTGKLVQERRRGFDTAKEAFEARTQSLKDYQDMGGISDSHMTYEKFMTEYYIPEYQGSVRQSTWLSRYRIFEEFIDRFGKQKPRDISTLALSKYKSDLLNNYSQNYARLKFGMLSRTLKHAKLHGMVKENLCEKVGYVPKERVDIDFWTKEEFEKILTTFNIDDFYEHFCFVLVWLYYMTGMRVNEATALHWKDNIDFDKKLIRVWHNMANVSQDKFERESKMKTDSARRIIAIDDDTIRILQEWQDRQKKLGKIDFVLSYNGYPTHKTLIARIITRHSELADVKRIQAKGLRHSHASLLINEYNANPLIIKQRLGHSDIQITLSVYSHLFPNVDSEIARQLTGSINIQTATVNQTTWGGNQNLKRAELNEITTQNS